MSRFKLLPPKPIYWFEVTENKERNLALLECLEDLSGNKIPQEDRKYAIKDMGIEHIFYNHRRCIALEDMYSDEGTMIRLIGTEITLIDEQI